MPAAVTHVFFVSSMRGRVVASLAQLSSATSGVDAAVLRAAFQLSGARPHQLLDELLEDASPVVEAAIQSARSRGGVLRPEPVHVGAALTCVTAGAVLLKSAAESGLSQEELQPLTQRFAVALCLPLLQHRPTESSQARAVAAALASAVADTGAWSLCAQLLAECVASWRLPESYRHGVAASSTELSQSTSADEMDAAHRAALTPGTACVLASAILEELHARGPWPVTHDVLLPSAAEMLHAALTALGRDSSSAALDAALVRDVIPVAVQLCLAHSQGAPHDAVRHAATSLLLSTSGLAAHRAAMALLVHFADTPVVSELPQADNGDGSTNGPFWAALRYCLWRPDDTRLRKQALHVLRCSLGPARCAAGGWSHLCTVLDLIEDYSMHLVTPAFQRLRLLHPAAHAAGEGHDDRGTGASPPADVPLEWVAVLWCKAVHHDNPTFRRQALAALAESDWSGGFARMLPESALFGPLLQAVNDPTNHRDGDDPAVAAAGVAAAAAARVRSAGLHHAERACEARRVLTAVCDVDGPTRPGLAAMIHVARAACEACVPGGDASASLDTTSLAGEPTTHADLALELLRRLAVLSCEQWGSGYRATRAQELLCAAAAIAPAGAISVAAAGRFLDALSRSGGLVGSGAAHAELLGTAQYWLAGAPARASWLAQGLDDHIAAYIRGGSDHDAAHSGDPTVEEMCGWATLSRQAAMLWSLLPDEITKQRLVRRVQADASGVYTRAHAPRGWTLRVLLLLDAVARAARSPSDDACMRAVTAGCVAECAALARASVVNSLCAPVSPDAPLGASTGDAASRRAERCNSSIGGPPSVLSPARVAAGYQACAALSALSACSRWRPSRDDETTYNALADAWRLCDADLWRLLQGIVAQAMNDSILGEEDDHAAMEMLDTAAACIAMAVDALATAAPDDQTTPPGRAKLECALFDFVARIATAYSARRTAGGTPAFLCGPQAAASGGVSTCVGARMRAVSSAACLPGACASATRAHADALGGAIAACAVAARGDSVDVFRAVRTLLPIVIASAPHDDGFLVRAAADAAARAAGDESLTTLNLHVNEDEPWGPMDEAAMREPLAPLACALCRCVWMGLNDEPNRPVIVLAECLAAVLHPALFAVEPLHAPRTGPLRAFVRNLLTVSEQSGRLMRVAAAALWASWLQFPHLVPAARYDRDMARINLFSVADHDADYSEDLLDPNAAAALRAVPGGVDAAGHGALAGEALAVRVTGVCAAHELARRGDEDGHADARGAARALMVRLLTDVVSDPELSAEVYRKNSVTHRRKVRAWQMLAALAPALPTDGSCDAHDVELLQLLERAFVSTLDKLNLPTVKQYEEAFFTAVMLRATRLLHSHVVPALDVRQAAARPYTLASLVLIAHAYLRHEREVSAQRAALPAVLAAVTPWACTHNHSLRTFAQTVLFELFDAFPAEHPVWLPPAGCAAAGAFDGTAGAVLESLRTFFVENDDCVKTRLATGRVGSMHPSVACTPAVIFGRGPDCPYQVDARFEGAPAPLVERISAFLDGLRADTRKARVATEGTLLLQAHQQTGQHVVASSAGGGTDALQKKVDPTTASMVDAALGGGEDALDGGRVCRGVALPRRQELVLCASLVEKPTNLGGLARTAEVFLLQRLVIGDLAVVQNPIFKGMAVTAERHVPITAVPGQALPNFLAAKRAEGYSLVGLEQTTGSVPLGAFEFPKRCVLLLGSEGLGIPAQLLPLLDVCVEIPQPGKQVRSLNVHVSASLAIYSYTCQWHHARSSMAR